MAFTRVNPGDPIQAHQLDQVIDALSGAASAGQPIAMTALNDATNYALTVQNDEATNSRALNVLKSDGTNLIRADVTGVTLGSPLNLPTGSITSAYILDAGIQNVDLGPDVARANLLTNGGFEIWQRGNGPFSAASAYAADGWWLSPATGGAMSVSRDTVNVASGSIVCAAVTVTSAATGGNYTELLAHTESGQLIGRSVSASVMVRTSTANAVRVEIYDGTTRNFSAYHPGDGTYRTLTLSATLGSGTGNDCLRVHFAAACTAYIDNACLVVGSVPANYVPMHPADDLARCLRTYEIIGASASDVFVGGVATGAGQVGDVSVSFRAIKPVAPTITKQGTWATANTNQPTIVGPSLSGCRIETSSLAAGQFYAINNAANCQVTVEANP